jgi:hypothetical protein
VSVVEIQVPLRGDTFLGLQINMKKKTCGGGGAGSSSSTKDIDI